MTTMSYKLRVDVLESSKDDDFKVFEEKYCERFAVARERAPISGKMHFHYYLECTCAQITIRKYWQETGYKGKYSLKQVDPLCLEYLSYIVKDRTDVRFHNMPEGIQAEAIADSDRVKSEMKAKKGKPKSDRATMFEYLDTLPLNTREQVCETIVQYYRDNDRLVRVHQMKSEYLTYCLGKQQFYQETRNGLVNEMMWHT